MNLKKKIFMMSLAASMVVPSNLALVASVATPVFATEKTTTVSLDKLKSIFGSNSNIVEADAHYIVRSVENKNVTISENLLFNKKVYFYDDVSLNLNNATITSNTFFYIGNNATLTLKGTGKVKSTSEGGGALLWVLQGTLDVQDDITLQTSKEVSSLYAVALNKTADGSSIKLNGTTIEGRNGVYVDGLLKKDDNKKISTLELTNVNIDGVTHGVYQAGYSEINIVLEDDNVIKGTEAGIETRAGELTVTGGKIIGGTSGNVSINNDSGTSSTKNVGVALNPYYSASENGQISITLNDTIVEGTAALAVADAGNKVKNDAEANKPIVNVNNSTLNGTSSSVYGDQDHLSFTLTNTTLNKPITAQAKSTLKVDTQGSNYPTEAVLNYKERKLPLDLTKLEDGVLSKENLIKALNVVADYNFAIEGDLVQLSVNKDTGITPLGSSNLKVSAKFTENSKIKFVKEGTVVDTVTLTSLNSANSSDSVVTQDEIEAYLQKGIGGKSYKLDESSNTISFSYGDNDENNTIGLDNLDDKGFVTVAVKEKVNPTPEQPTTTTLTPSDVALATGSYTYTGSAIEPAVTVTVGNKTLVKDTDYEVSYANNTNAGTGTVTVEGKGSYTGTVTKTFTVAQKTIDVNDLYLEEGPYTLNNGKDKPHLEVILNKDKPNETRLVEGTDYYAPVYEGVEDGGEATVTVFGKGNYTGTATKTYVLLDDNDNSVDISFTIAADDNPNSDKDETVNLSIPVEYLKKDEDGNLIITNKTLGDALTLASDKDTSTTDETKETPSYIFTVTGLENSSEKQSPVIMVKVQPISWIRLILDVVDKITPEDAEVMSEMVEVSEVSLLADEPVAFEAAENKVIIYEQLQKIDKNGDNIISKKEMEDYISGKPEYSNASVPKDFKEDFSQARQLGTDITLNKAGFIEIEVQAEGAPVTDDKPSGGNNTGGSSTGGSSTGGSNTDKPGIGTPVTMYRLYNRLTGEHLYTLDKNERDHLLTSDTWQDEGEGWIAPSTSNFPVYRLLNPNTTDHHYTMDENEYKTLQTLGWVGENIAFFSADPKSGENITLYRLYNPNEKGAGSHHYTTDENEKNTLVKLGWQYEGTAWAGLKSK